MYLTCNTFRTRFLASTTSDGPSPLSEHCWANCLTTMVLLMKASELGMDSDIKTAMDLLLQVVRDTEHVATRAALVQSFVKRVEDLFAALGVQQLDDFDEVLATMRKHCEISKQMMYDVSMRAVRAVLRARSRYA